jgi:hypothetical protein
METQPARETVETVVRPRPTRTQRGWWGFLALFGSFSVAGAIGIVYEMGPEEAFVPVVVCCGALVSIGAFASGKLLRQKRTADATVITVSDDGTLHVVDSEGDATQSLVGAHALFVDHGRTVDRMYRAEIPSSLASSGPYGAIVVDRDDGRHVLVFAGELPAREQQILMAAATPFLASDAVSETPIATPDEQSASATPGRKLRDFAAFLGVILVLALPAFAGIVIQTAVRGHLDPNTLWFSILICVAAVVVVIVRFARRWKRGWHDDQRASR